MIEINGKKYEFRMGLKAILNFEKETGLSVTSLGEGMKFSTFVDLVYSCVKSAGSKVTKEALIDDLDKDPNAIGKITIQMQENMSAFGAIAQEAEKQDTP